MASAGRVVPLSYGQQALLPAILNGPPGALNVGVSVALGPEPVEPGDVGELLRRLQARNDALRSRLMVRRGRVALEVHDLANVPPIGLEYGQLPSEREWTVRGFRAWAYQGFRRGSLPLARAMLVHRQGTVWLHLMADGLVCDGWSIAVLTEEVSAIWSELTGGVLAGPPPGSFAEYLDGQGASRDDAVQARYATYWGDVLSGGVTADLRRRPDGSGTHHLTFVVPPSLNAHLKTLRRELATTDFCLLASALATVLTRRTGQDALLVHTHVCDRQSAAHLRTIGCLINYVGVRIEVGPSFPANVRSCQQSLLSAFRYQTGPFLDMAASRRDSGAVVVVEPHGYAGEAWNAWGRDCRSPESFTAKMAAGEVDWQMRSSAPLMLGDLSFGYKPAAWGYALGLIFRGEFMDEPEARQIASEMLDLLSHDHAASTVA